MPMYFAQDIGLQSAGKEASQFVRDIRLSVRIVRPLLSYYYTWPFELI